MNTVQRMSTHNVRAEEIFHLETMLNTSYTLPDTIKDALELDTDEILEALGIAFDDEDNYTDDVQELLQHSEKTGWLIRFSTPVPVFYNDDGVASYNYSWAHYANSWFYGQDFDAMCEEAITRSQRFVANRKAKFLSK